VIQGLGIDIVCVSEFAKLAPDPDSAFLKDHFTPSETAYSERALGTNVQHLAARYAAKEAAIKALESAHLFRPKPLPRADYREIEVLNDPWGRPYLTFHGEVGTLVQKLKIVAYVSLSHDGDYAIAQVVLS